MNAERIICPICNEQVNRLLYQFHLNGEKAVVERLKVLNPEWSEKDGICTRCIDHYQTEVILKGNLLPDIGPFFPVKNFDEFVILPLALRLGASQRYTGKGTCICFIDSGFVRHPDIHSYRQRVKLVVDIPNNKILSEDRDLFASQGNWHGTMTTVVGAGDGFLSNGLYKSLASEAELVLLKVQDEKGEIPEHSILKAFEWLRKNHHSYGIRVVNVSIGCHDYDNETKQKLGEIISELYSLGLLIIAAAGNTEKERPGIPAIYPEVIAVGGMNDNNLLDKKNMELYHSSFGYIEHCHKPDVIAPAAWVAAPILPGSPEQKEAEILYSILNTALEKLHELDDASWSDINIDSRLLSDFNTEEIKQVVRKRILEAKYISPHYMHVDGTSFAAPIISAIVAQMLEAAPHLHIAVIREIILGTAKKIPGYPSERQGFGVVQPGLAIQKVVSSENVSEDLVSPEIDWKKNVIRFKFRNECAQNVALAGSFSNWSSDVLLLEPGKRGIWQLELPILEPGIYPYKFFINGNDWVEDVCNPYRAPDGFKGFNSLLIIQN